MCATRIGMEYIPFIASAALVVSALSLWVSWRARHHNQIVSFEQRRQEIRQILLEGQIIAVQSINEWNRGIAISERQLIIGKMSESLARKFVEVANIVRDGIARKDVTRHQYDEILKDLEQMPPSPSTQARLDLERIGGTAIKLKNELQEQFDKIYNAVDGLEDTLKRIGRDISKSG